MLGGSRPVCWYTSVFCVRTDVGPNHLGQLMPQKFVANAGTVDLVHHLPNCSYFLKKLFIGGTISEIFRLYVIGVA